MYVLSISSQALVLFAMEGEFQWPTMCCIFLYKCGYGYSTSTVQIGESCLGNRIDKVCIFCFLMHRSQAKGNGLIKAALMKSWIHG